MLRLRTETFRALCPDGPGPFSAWWSGRPPERGEHSALIVLDPFAVGRARLFVGLEDALTVRARLRGYAEAAESIPRRGAVATLPRLRS